MRCEILAVGTELLLGDIVNTNAQYIAKRLSDIGICVYHHSVVGDNPERLKKAYDIAFSRSDIVITTGGLGPTKDDLTKEVAFEYFNKEAVLHEDSFSKILAYFNKLGREVSYSNKKQAYFPKDSVVLNNNNGTAPGCIINENNKILIMLPGPPREMKPMFEESVIPYLNNFTNEILVSKVLRVIGVGESTAAEMLGDLLDNENPTVAPYAKEGEVIFRITARGKDEGTCNDLIAPIKDKIKDILGINVYGEGDQTLEYVLGDILIKNNLTIATAESCTGGMVAAKLINYPGISASFLEGAVTYTNSSKIERLGVKKSTLEKFGAVSHEVAEEMALGIVKATGAHIGLSTTGIAGPGGGTKEKPVGLVYIGICYRGEVTTRELMLNGSREKIRERATMIIIDALRRELINNCK